MGGSKENRHTPGMDHWSIAVKDGKPLEKVWRKEVPIPRGGPHRYIYVQYAYSGLISWPWNIFVTLLLLFK